MNDYERSMLEHYKLSTAFPTEWPADESDSDESDNENDQVLRNSLRNSSVQKSKPRYSALIRATGSHKSFIIGSQRADNGVENLVQRDEPDPLGTTDSVVTRLKNLGLPVLDDSRLRNKFLLSSTTFSPSLFLSQAHSTASTQDLLNGLDVLSRSIDQKSESLKVLVESNFERFVRAKATIDNVYKEMKYQGEEPTQTLTRPRTHSRHASRNSFRTSSSNQASTPILSPDEKKKNALVKESEYGVLGIKSHLLDVSAKAEEVWGPALGGQEKENNLRLITTTIEQFKELYQVCGSISGSIKRRDYEAIVETYNKAKRFARDAKILSDNLSSAVPNDLQIYQIILAAYVWNDVEEMVEDLKRDVWRKLIAIQSTSFKKDESPVSIQDQHMEYIEILLELDVKENPLWIWLSNRFNYLKKKIQTTNDRSKIEIEILRRQLANSDKPTTQIIVSNFKSLGRHTTNNKPTSFDSSDVTEFWERTNKFIGNMLSNSGILGEVIEFWKTVQNFIDGRAKRMYSTGLNQNSSQYHRLSPEEASKLRNGTLELITTIRECVSEFFLGPPIEDISCLFSPISPMPRTPVYSTHLNVISNSTRDHNMSYDLNNLPPPSPKRNEEWEKFAFWPPWSNSLSGVYYLGKLLVYIGTGANEIAAIFPERQDDDSSYERLKSFVSGIRERCVTAVCAAWNKDAEDIKVLEDWQRSSENHDLTKMPFFFGAFGSVILSGMQKILYISEALSEADSINVVTPPSAKLLQMVRSQFVTTLYKSLAGLVENAEKSVKKNNHDWTSDFDGLTIPTPTNMAASIGVGAVNISDRNARMLLTLSNLQALRIDTVPNLITKFENAFSVKLTDESKTIRDVLGQIDARLFSSFTRPSVDSLRNIIRVGISSPEWAPTEKPQEVRPYVYEALLSLVLLHSQVSTTAPSLTSKVLSHLLEQISFELFDTLKLRQKWTLPDLMQATLDVEFISQTLNQYTTNKASEIQSQIYQELDKGTDDSSRAELQTELPEMRIVLKKLRDLSRTEFACFKKGRSRSEKTPITTI